MKKTTIKAFTLVEMLIVIVIIGILIAALLPRMNAAQGRARDVARKTALSQIQSAIVTSQGDKGEWPEQDKAVDGINVKDTESLLLGAGMTSIPEDPLRGNAVSGLAGLTTSGGQYGYMVTTRNGTDKGGFVLMAKTEVEGGSNRVFCASGTNKDTLTGGLIKKGEDVINLVLCNKVSKKEASEECGKQADGSCRYNDESELRYILAY